MTLTREICDKVRVALEAAGARDLVLSQSGRSKQRFDFRIDGRAGHFTFASTPSPGGRAILNAVAVAKRTVREYREGRRNGTVPCSTR